MTFSLYAMALSSVSRSNRANRANTRESVGDPLDALQIDAFLMHLPKRRQLAQPLDLAHDEVGHVVDLFLRIEATQAEPDARVRQLVAHAERAKDVARLEAGRRARRAGAHRDVLDG